MQLLNLGGKQPPVKIYSMRSVLIVFAAFFAIRLVSLAISIRNERRLKALGATQHGKRNSLLLTLAHLIFYSAALYEAYAARVAIDRLATAGIVIMAFAYAMLFYVIYKLRDVWTVKLYIAPQHRVERSFLFRTVRHPNYYLNILPELIGVALLCHAWRTLLIGLPIYAYLLYVRIRQEENAMRALWQQA